MELSLNRLGVPFPSVAETVAGEPIRGSYWAHPKANDIFQCSRAIRNPADVLVCRLVGGKVTYVHRRLWPALVRLAERFDAGRIAAIRENSHSADYGTIEKGKIADLVLLDGDPLADIGNTRRIAAVVSNGRLLRRPALDALLKQAELAARRN